MQGGISVNKQVSGNEPVISRIIRKDFINDYGPLLTENGFVKKRNTFYRVHDGVFLYVALVFFSSEWTVTFAAYPFSQGYEDMNGKDGYRVSSMIRDLKRLNKERSTLDSSDRSEENYQYIREQYCKAFFETAFPEFNKVTNIDAYIDKVLSENALEDRAIERGEHEWVFQSAEHKRRLHVGRCVSFMMVMVVVRVG